MVIAMSVSSSGSSGGDCGPSPNRDCAGGTTRLSFTGGQNGPAEQDTTPWGDPGPSPQDAVSNVALCTPPLPSVENLDLTVDGWWRQSVSTPPEALDPIPAIRTTMVLHGYDIYSRALATGRDGRRRRSTPSPGDGDAEFTPSDTPVRRVVTSSEHPASSRDRKQLKAIAPTSTSHLQHEAGRRRGTQGGRPGYAASHRARDRRPSMIYISGHIVMLS